MPRPPSPPRPFPPSRLGGAARAWLDEALAEAEHAAAHEDAEQPVGPYGAPPWELRYAAAGRNCGPEHADSVRALLLVEARAALPVVTRLYEQGTAAEVRSALAAFAEPRFLHQTRTRTATGALHGTDDLDEALTGPALPDRTPWRAHFHIPLHAPPTPPLTSTLPVLRSALTRLVGGPRPLTAHLEVETYTWQALPAALRPRSRVQLADGSAAELTLARDLLSDLGLSASRNSHDLGRDSPHRRAGLLEVHTQDGMEYLDPMASRAFAVADHQIAHIYVRRPEDLAATREALQDLPGVERLLEDEDKKANGLDHPRSGELVAVADPDAWFTYYYYYWLDDARAPDFAQLVEIHRKPGYDPAELFLDPQDPYVRIRAATAVARKKLGMRYRMAVVPLKPSPVRGSHGRLPMSDEEGPLILCSTPHAFTGPVRATEVKSLLLDLAGLH
ncbi:alkaline phosphatase family protein [Streptomyces sp. NPDC002476]|uniref:alkaline phosphatase family protein n=1 Tax=Streptomyces sp. NPDC002476 TaxID=3364648 RepID=UPI0036AC5B65